MIIHQAWRSEKWFQKRPGTQPLSILQLLGATAAANIIQIHPQKKDHHRHEQRQQCRSTAPNRHDRLHFFRGGFLCRILATLRSMVNYLLHASLGDNCLQKFVHILPLGSNRPQCRPGRAARASQADMRDTGLVALERKTHPNIFRVHSRARTIQVNHRAIVDVQTHYLDFGTHTPVHAIIPSETPGV